MGGGDRPGLLGQVAPDEPSDACCWACSGGGDVACCDGCRAVYHLSCIGLEQLPADDWFCPLCCCRECKEACRGQEDPLFINIKLVPVIPKQLQPRAGPHHKLPAGPGYLCPQQARQWLQQPQSEQPEEPQAAGAAPAAPARSDGGGADTAEEQQPKAKHQKQEPRSSSGSVSPTGSAAGAASFVRCCCCQAACHVNCLPAPLKQQYSARPPLSSLLSPPPTPLSKANGTPSKRGTPCRQQGKASPSSQKQQQQQQAAAGEAGVPPSAPVDPYFCSLACQQVANQLASRCAQGLVQVDALADGTPIAFQLVQPAAVAAALAGSNTGSLAILPAAATAGAAAAAGNGSDGGAAASSALPQAAVGLLGTGVAAGHSVAQAQVLARVLRDATTLLAGQLGPAWEVRCLDNSLPWLVGGLRQAVPGGLLDLSHCHVGLLWVGATLAGAAVLRLHGPSLLEVPLAATQQELQHKQLGRLLLGCIERLALETCRVRQAWLPALNDVARPCTGVSLLPTCEQQQEQPGQQQQLQLDPGSSVRLLGLDSAAAAAAAADAGPGGSSSGAVGKQRQRQQQSQQQRRKSQADAQCWAHQLGYGAAVSVADWMQLPKHMLLRFSYVPFLTKRLSPDSLVSLPKFSTRPLASAAAGGAAGAKGQTAAAAASPVAAAAAAEAKGPAAAAPGQAGSSAWPADQPGPNARMLVAAAFPHPADVPQEQRQPVRRTRRQQKRRKWQEEDVLLEEDVEDVLMAEAVEEQEQGEQEEEQEEEQAQKQLQMQRNKRQQFQEQVRQQFLARQQVINNKQRRQQQSKQQGQQADCENVAETAAAGDAAAAPGAAAPAAGSPAAATEDDHTDVATPAAAVEAPDLAAAGAPEGHIAPA